MERTKEIISDVDRMTNIQLNIGRMFNKLKDELKQSDIILEDKKVLERLHNPLVVQEIISELKKKNLLDKIDDKIDDKNDDKIEKDNLDIPQSDPSVKENIEKMSDINNVIYEIIKKNILDNKETTFNKKSLNKLS